MSDTHYSFGVEFRPVFRDADHASFHESHHILNTDEIEAVGKLDDDEAGEGRDAEGVAGLFATVFVGEFPDEPFFFCRLETFVLVRLNFANRERERVRLFELEETVEPFFTKILV